MKKDIKYKPKFILTVIIFINKEKVIFMKRTLLMFLLLIGVLGIAAVKKQPIPL